MESLSKLQGRKLCRYLERGGVLAPDLTGWRMRETLDEANNQCHRVFFSPGGLRFRSKPEILDYMQGMYMCCICRMHHTFTCSRFFQTC